MSGAERQKEAEVFQENALSVQDWDTAAYLWEYAEDAFSLEKKYLEAYYAKHMKEGCRSMSKVISKMKKRNQ